MQSAMVPQDIPTTTTPTRSSRSRNYVCPHCNGQFPLSPEHQAPSMPICPYCGKVSVRDEPSLKAPIRCLSHAVVGIIFLVVGIGVTVGTQYMGSISVIWIGAFIVAFMNIVASCYYCCVCCTEQ
ncbi:type II phosphatidylinositol 4,5-bisphosphate 4-phosphatase-like [Diadema setosum]|uniref:type II phosphatidylinositol 4,5-bisphosphate 4-phosphatase-like n=1 Tax=Diadema setosum TaxID=31175 RepID=UPI003B3A513F